VLFISTELPTVLIPLVKSVRKLFTSPWHCSSLVKFHRYFSENSGTIHFLIALLITVFYRQNHRQIEKSLVLFGGFLKILIKMNILIKYYRQNHRRIEK